MAEEKVQPMVTLSVQIDGIAHKRSLEVRKSDVQKVKARIFREGFADVQNNGMRVRTYSPYKITHIDEIK